MFDTLIAAKGSGISHLSGFADGLLEDYDAVHNGLTFDWSSGAVEDNVNRVKMIKRTMYGRAEFHLLRGRVLLSEWKIRHRGMQDPENIPRTASCRRVAYRRPPSEPPGLPNSVVLIGERSWAEPALPYMPIRSRRGWRRGGCRQRSGGSWRCRRGIR